MSVVIAVVRLYPPVHPSYSLAIAKQHRHLSPQSVSPVSSFYSCWQLWLRGDRYFHRQRLSCIRLILASHSSIPSQAVATSVSHNISLDTSARAIVRLYSPAHPILFLVDHESTHLYYILGQCATKVSLIFISHILTYSSLLRATKIALSCLLVSLA